MDETTIDRAAMGRLAKALVFICGADHPTTVALKAASGDQKIVALGALLDLCLQPSWRAPATSPCFRGVIGVAILGRNDSAFPRFTCRENIGKREASPGGQFCHFTPELDLFGLFAPSDGGVEVRSQLDEFLDG